MAMTLAGPGRLSWGGSGNLGMGRPVGPTYPRPSPDSTSPSAATDSSSRGAGTSWISERLFAAVDLATCRQTSLPADPERPIIELMGSVCSCGETTDRADSRSRSSIGVAATEFLAGVTAPGGTRATAPCVLIPDGWRRACQVAAGWRLL